MKLGVVIGTVWASRKVKELEGCRLYVVQPVTTEGRPVDLPVVAADPQRLAAPGDRIVFVTSTDATQAFDTGRAAVNASVVELVEGVF